jgi:ketosteroid isomerase-like protein
MATGDAEIVRAYFDVTNDGDFARAMSFYTDDVELVVTGNTFLEVGRFEGKEAVGTWFANWFRAFQRGYQFDVREARELDDAVLVVAEHEGRGRASGAEVRTTTGYLFRVRNGQIVRIELFASRAEALEALRRPA